MTTQDRLLGDDSIRKASCLQQVLFGFWPSAITVALCLFLCVVLNVYWSADGSLELSEVDGSDIIVTESKSPSLLLIFRTLAALVAVAVPIEAVVSCRKNARKGGYELQLHGAEPFCFCTIWTWVGMALYFAQTASTDIRYQLGGEIPSSSYAAVLWVWFEVMYAMAWLVFLATWLALIPMAHASGNQDAINMLWSPAVLFQHNANLVLMETELLMSSWSMHPKHVIFCIYFGIAYIVFNWWLRAKTGFLPYFFLDYNTAGVPALVILVSFLYLFFWIGVESAHLAGK